jgi:carbon-monoxide dehydrogenase medium subunit
MFPAAFDYIRARSVDEVLASLGEHGGDARVLAGGQSLIPAMKYRLIRPAVLVDINRIEELAYITAADGELRVGALTRDYALEISGDVRSGYALLADVCDVVADPVVRQTGTVVGSLCQNDPAGDWPVAALAARASVVVRGKGGTRTVPIDEFLVDSFTTAVEDGELALEVRFPTPAARTSGAFVKMERKVGDFATGSAGVNLTLGPDGTIVTAGIALGAAGATAVRVAGAERLLCGSKATKELVRAAADESRKAADPASDTRGTAEYKKELAGVLTARALVIALGRLGVEGLS